MKLNRWLCLPKEIRTESFRIDTSNTNLSQNPYPNPIQYPYGNPSPNPYGNPSRNPSHNTDGRSLHCPGSIGKASVITLPRLSGNSMASDGIPWMDGDGDGVCSSRIRGEFMASSSLSMLKKKKKEKNKKEKQQLWCSCRECKAESSRRKNPLLVGGKKMMLKNSVTTAQLDSSIPSSYSSEEDARKKDSERRKKKEKERKNKLFDYGHQKLKGSDHHRHLHPNQQSYHSHYRDDDHCHHHLPCPPRCDDYCSCEEGEFSSCSCCSDSSGSDRNSHSHSLSFNFFPPPLRRGSNPRNAQEDTGERAYLLRNRKNGHRYHPSVLTDLEEEDEDRNEEKDNEEKDREYPWQVSNYESDTATMEAPSEKVNYTAESWLRSRAYQRMGAGEGGQGYFNKSSSNRRRRRRHSRPVSIASSQSSSSSVQPASSIHSVVLNSQVSLRISSGMPSTTYCDSESLVQNSSGRGAGEGGAAGALHSRVNNESIVAVVKSSQDPFLDFRDSMVDMILEKKIDNVSDLDKLLQCFLNLNSIDHHEAILQAFTEIWEKIFTKLRNPI